MEIGIFSTVEGLNASVDSGFSRCRSSLSINAETIDGEQVSNKSAMDSGSDGAQSVQAVIKSWC